MEQPPPLLPEVQPEPGQPVAMSLMGRLFNVLATPGDVFEVVKATPKSVANWLVPTLLLAIMSVVAVMIIFSQPNVLQQIREQQAKAMDQRVKAGKMTQEDADKALTMMEKFGGETIMKVTGSVGAVVVCFARVFWWGLILWLVGRWALKSRFGYLKAVEVVGIATIINLLGGLVGLLLAVSMGRLGASPSLALLVTDFDLSNKTHMLLAAVNPFYFWSAGVMAVGLARLAGVSFGRAAVPVFGYLIAQQGLLVAAGLGQFAM